MKFTELSKSLKEELSPVYVIEGNDAYFTDHAVSALREACNIAQPALNDTRTEGETLKGDALSAFFDSLYTLPFFDERRFVRLSEYHPSESEFSRGLQKYLVDPCPTTVLAIVNHEKKGNTVDYKKKKGITYVDCSHADEETLTKWLFALLRREGLSADTDAVARMTRYCAFDAARLKKESEKLLLLLGEGGRVTREVVEEQIERDVEYKIYELTQASSRGDFTSFTEISEDLFKKGYEESSAIFSLSAHYKTLLQIAELGRLSDAQIAERTGQKPYAVKKNREIVDRLGERKIRDRFLALERLSAEIRSGKITSSGALTDAIAKIFFE